MSAHEQILHSRRRRRHRNRRALVMGPSLAAGYLLVIVFLPDDGALDGLVTLAFIACINGISLYENRDAFQWKLARDTFAIGAAVGLGWTIIATVRQALDAHYAPDAGDSLGVTGGAWALAWLVQQARIDRGRRRADVRSGTDEGA